jgi:hypothetical protein
MVSEEPGEKGCPACAIAAAAAAGAGSDNIECIEG